MQKTNQKYRDLTVDELEAVRAFADHFGRDWKEKLAMVYWYNARIFTARNGRAYHELHKLRNELGPRWLAKYELPA